MSNLIEQLILLFHHRLSNIFSVLSSYTYKYSYIYIYIIRLLIKVGDSSHRLRNLTQINLGNALEKLRSDNPADVSWRQARIRVVEIAAYLHKGHWIPSLNSDLGGYPKLHWSLDEHSTHHFADGIDLIISVRPITIRTILEALVDSLQLRT